MLMFCQLYFCWFINGNQNSALITRDTGVKVIAGSFSIPCNTMQVQYMLSSCVYLLVCLSITSLCSTKIAKLRITKTMLYNNSLLFWCCWRLSPSPAVGTECGSSSGLWQSSSWPHYTSHHDASLASSLPASDLQDGGVGVEVSALCSTVLLDLCVLAVGSAVVWSVNYLKN